MSNRLLPALALTLLLPVHAADLTPEKVQEAIDKGVKWLKTRQDASGAFLEKGSGGMNSPGGLEAQYPLGTTALASLTLLKCGVEPNDPVIEKAFAWMYAQSLSRTYEVAVLVLAIEARFAPPKELLEKEEEKKGYATVARKHFGKLARPVDQAKLKECTDWLVGNRAKGGCWRYPGSAGDGSDMDHSATQYAMLALKSASRLGCEIPDDVWERVADHFVEQQDPTGDEVPWFPVPAAEGPIMDMSPPAKRIASMGGTDKKDGGTQTREKKGPGTAERITMHARGWSYLPRPLKDGVAEAQPVPTGMGSFEKVSTGSMTASGIAALVIAKSELESSKSSWSKRSAKVEKAIRDGAAWMAKHYQPDHNPVAGGAIRLNWTYYYLYGCERAGVLAGTYTWGPQDWWDPAAEWLLGKQTPEGAWPQEEVLSAFADTCFAMLFLRRATIPLVPLPKKRTMTGQGH